MRACVAMEAETSLQCLSRELGLSEAGGGKKDPLGECRSAALKPP